MGSAPNHLRTAVSLKSKRRQDFTLRSQRMASIRRRAAARSLARCSHIDASGLERVPAPNAREARLPNSSPRLGGATGFEPATPRTTTWCANQLRHAPHHPCSRSTPGRIRTSGLRLRRPLLCPLSYGRMATLRAAFEFELRSNIVLLLHSSTARRARKNLLVSSYTDSSPLRIPSIGPPESTRLRATTTRVAEAPLARRPSSLPVPSRSSGCLERETGIEPASLAWKARALPLSYSRAIRRGRIRTGGLSVPNAAR